MTKILSTFSDRRRILGVAALVVIGPTLFMSSTTQAQSAAARAIPSHGPIYDSHAHLISSDVVRYPHRDRSKDRAPAVPRRIPPGTLGIPGGMHGPNPVNEKPTAEQLHTWMKQLNVAGIAAVQKGTIYGTDNRYIVDAVDLFPDQMSAVIIIDPDAPETLQTIRDLARRRVVGIRFFGAGVADRAAWLSSQNALNTWALAAELGLVVEIEGPHAGRDELIPVVESMADRFPNTPVVLDHVFTPTVTDPDFGLDRRYAGLAARKNISVKWTSINLDQSREQGVPPEKVLRRVVDVFGADKVMWGSDIGTSSGTYKEMIERGVASTALLTDEERRKVLHDTGRRVFGSSKKRD